MRRLIVLDFFLIFSAAKGRGELKPRIVRQYRVAIIILSRLRRYIHTSFSFVPGGGGATHFLYHGWEYGGHIGEYFAQKNRRIFFSFGQGWQFS
jgi:hypothetical protein